MEVVKKLYLDTATRVLGSTRTLAYNKLAWEAKDYAQLGGALPYCGAIVSLELIDMALGEADAAAVLESGTPDAAPTQAAPPKKTKSRKDKKKAAKRKATGS